MIKKALAATMALAFLIYSDVKAQVFDDFFTDKTLRIDYTFAGNAVKQEISLDQLSVSPRWYGKRKRLAELPVEGYGQITVRAHATGEVIYRQSFSTLFQEWLSYPEADRTRKSFENVFLVPMPKDTVDVTVDLRDNRREIMTTLTHMVVPSDILIRHIGEKEVMPFKTVQQAADTTRCINIAFVAEGYQEAEMNVFEEDVRVAVDALFSHEPFKSSREKFNIVAVESPSKDSGTSIPHEGIWKNTVLSSHFDTFYSKRYLTTLHLKDLHDVLAGIPYEHIIVLVNTDNYGGGGILNSYNLSMTHHRLYRPVVVHEFGHSFAGLADEYAYEYEDIPMYPHDIEPWEPNITTMANFAEKWQDMLPEGTPVPTAIGDNNQIGLYEGAGYSMKGVYRAYPDCRMRTNENPEFCNVCKKAIQNLIDFYTK